MGKRKKFLPFEEARKIVHTWNISKKDDWKKATKTKKFPENISRYPESAYKNEWQNWHHWLGHGRVSRLDVKVWSFEKARDYVRKLELKTKNEWMEYSKTKRPNFIPSDPARRYKTEWRSLPDWLGNGRVSRLEFKIWSFDKARDFVRKQNLKNVNDWNIWYKSNKRPIEIPSDPARRYKTEWRGFPDWFGTDTIDTKKMGENFGTYNTAKQFAIKNKIKTQTEWDNLVLNKVIPKNIPKRPNSFYKKTGDWQGWGHFTGTGNIKPGDIEYVSYNTAKQFAIKNKIKSQTEWAKFAKNHVLPKKIPSNVPTIYKKTGDWQGWGHFTGTGNIQPGKEIFVSYDEAKKIIKKFNFKSKDDWEKLSKNKRGKNIPRNADNYYKKTGDWQGWADFLGYEGKIWNSMKVKKLLNSMIDSKIIYSEDGAILLTFLGRNKVDKLQNNRHSTFFKSLAYAAQTKGGLKQILDYANSDSNKPPEFTEFELSGQSEESFEERKTILDVELEQKDTDSLDVSEKSNPLSNPKVTDSKIVLDNTLVFDSVSLDDEAMEFYLNYFVHKLWTDTFENEKNALNTIKNRKEKNYFSNQVINQFLSEYEGTKNLEIPSNQFGKEPFLMQRYCAYKIKNEQYLANFSGTGAGKTFSAILSSRVIDSKMTLIICPNDVVIQWNKIIKDSFSDSIVVTGKNAFYEKRDETKHKYLIINWDKLNQNSSNDLILELKSQKIDFIILDELHFSKNEKTDRTKRLRAILSYSRKLNKSKVLGMTATPIVNNLVEGKVLLELITGKIFNRLETKPTAPNATTLYEKFTNISIRQKPNYNAKLHYWDVDAPTPHEAIGKYMIGNPMAIEQYLTDFRLPEILKHIDGQTIIYTDYVGSKLPGHDSITNKIELAVKNKKLSYGFYIGGTTDGLDKFKRKEIKVLIASRPISVGIDGLQEYCNNLIFNVLPWTNAQYRQIIGRIERKGQKNTVNIHHIRVNVSGVHYDRDEKIKRINDKKTLADCAIDGTLPDHILVTPEQAAKAAAEWLLRLSRGEIAVVTREEWEYELPPSEKKKRLVKYGEFSEMNRRFYTTHSSNLHLRLTQNKEEWITYHKLQEEAEKTWQVIPCQEIIRRLKKLSTSWKIGDFGCGREPFIQNALGRRVKSFDHVAMDDLSKVKPCDMSDVSPYVLDGKLDAGVFCLSLMGTNWSDYIKEAARCIIKHGVLFIAEPTRRIKEKINLHEVLNEYGFDVVEEDEIDTFTFLEARKIK